MQEIVAAIRKIQQNASDVAAHDSHAAPVHAAR
jgi:hypothetical protein